MPHGGTVDPAWACQLYDAAEGVSSRHQEPRRPIGSCRNIELVARRVLTECAKRFAARNQRSHQKQQPNVRDGRIANQDVAIEETRPAVPQQQRGDVTRHAEREKNGQPNECEEEDGYECWRIPPRQHIGQNTVGGVQVRSRYHSFATEQLRSPGHQMREVDG